MSIRKLQGKVTRQFLLPRPNRSLGCVPEPSAADCCGSPHVWGKPDLGCAADRNHRAPVKRPEVRGLRIRFRNSDLRRRMTQLASTKRVTHTREYYDEQVKWYDNFSYRQREIVVSLVHPTGFEPVTSGSVGSSLYAVNQRGVIDATKRLPSNYD